MAYSSPITVARRAARALALAAALAAAFAAPAAAQSETPTLVSATDPAGVLKVLEGSGYDVEYFERKEDGSDAYIEISAYDGPITVRFSDCDEKVPDFCETLILSAWWDRETPISDAALAAANIENKYVTVYRANDGDPVMYWAILTRREGIAATLFLNAVQRFQSIAGDFREKAFENDTPAGAVEQARITLPEQEPRA